MNGPREIELGGVPLLPNEAEVARRTLNGVPAQTDLVITIQKDGYRPVLRLIETASANMDCAPISFPFAEWGYPMPPTSVRFPVLAGYITGPIGIFCTEK